MSLRRLTRRRLLREGGAGAAGVALAGMLGQRAAAQAPQAMNVVVVIIDNVRADYLGCYGNKRVKTPNIDRFARQSLRFTRFRPESFPTIPARRAIMTGRRSFPFRGWRPTRGLPRQPGWQRIPRKRPMFTDVLKRAGYRTGYVTDNPWILGSAYDGFRRRFDRTVTVRGQTPFRGRPRGRVSRRRLRRHVLPAQRRSGEVRRIRRWLAANSGRKGERDYLPARVFRAAARWLEREAPRAPFALVVDCFDPHEPWDPPQSRVRRYGSGRVRGVKPIQPFESPGQPTADARLRRAAVRATRHLYAAELGLVDHWFGFFMRRLDELGLRENTLVVLVSDHGVLLGERGWIGKHSSQMHREVYRVPFMIRHPAGRRAGRTSSYFASFHDIAPTVLSSLGRRVPKAMEGVDLSAIFRGRTPPKRRHFTARYGNYVMSGDGRWLLIAAVDGKNMRLFDTRRDRGERRDLARRKRKVARRLWRNVIRDARGRRPARLG